MPGRLRLLRRRCPLVVRSIPMPSSPQPDTPFAGLPEWLCRLWAGLECGVIAGAFVLPWFCFHSLLRTEYWWSKLNVVALPIFGDAVFRSGLNSISIVGAACLLLLHCAAGAVFGLLKGGLSNRRAALFAALYAVAWQLFSARFVWPRLGTGAATWFPFSATGPASLILFGALLRYRALFERVDALFGRSRGAAG